MRIDRTEVDPATRCQFESIAGLFAYYFQKEGAEFLTALLDAEPDDRNRDSLLNAAAELDALELPQVAAIVRQAGLDTPPEQCPHEPNTGNYRAWHMQRAKKPFDTPEQAEACLEGMGFQLEDDDIWRNRFDTEAKVLPLESRQFQILSLRAGADWGKYL
jgi:hypothetical protein